MSLKDSIRHFIIMQVMERPARRKGMVGLTKKLELAGKRLKDKFSKLEASESRQKTLRHIIAIERWGQSRLKVALGEALKEDENHSYKPDAATSWADLQALFAQTRAETLSIAKELTNSAINPLTTVKHNQFGPISLLAWLRYLEVHASLEARRHAR